MLRVLLRLFLGALSIALMTSHSFGAGRAKYFILVVWDGMRPDFVSAELTPNLQQLRDEGVWFANHHSAFPTSTEVNGTVLATGMFPQHSGVIANKEYRPEIDPLRPFGTQSFPAVRRGDELTQGKYLRVPTVAEFVQAHGDRTAVAGAKPVALLHDRLARSESSSAPVWFVEGSLPESLGANLVKRFGPFPRPTSPNSSCDAWATRCLTEAFWEQEMPRYSVLWLSEPDYSQHRYGPGSPQALAAIRSCDERLATVLRELDRRGVRAQTDILIVSDHGFSTIQENGDVAATLRAAGIDTRSSWKQPPTNGQVVSVGNGGSVLLYVTDRTPDVVHSVVTVLQRQRSTGVIFTREGLPGTFPLAEARIAAPTAPDVIVVSSWHMSTAANNHPQVDVVNDGYSEYAVGGGMHVTLSPSDLHNLAVASGPDFRRGTTNALPSGNVDIAPTLLWLMNIKPREPLDGRVLSEALVGGQGPSIKAEGVRKTAQVKLEDGTWQQYLAYTELDGVRYLEEGNGSWAPLKKAQENSTASSNAGRSVPNAP
jgi:arylsulfatase A-like enzyme